MKQLYKQVCKIEKEYVITPDAFIAELIETYQKTKGWEIMIDYDCKPESKLEHDHERGFKPSNTPWNKGLRYKNNK
ncbi:MAG: hypothetical protein ACRD8W_06415 [Nitrososphaeraceae archaeon]